MSDRERRLSKISGATEQKKILEDKLKERQQKDQQTAIAKACNVKFSEAAENSYSHKSDPNSDVLEEPALNKVIDDPPVFISNLNMTNPEYEAQLTDINLAEIEVKDKIKELDTYKL